MIWAQNVSVQLHHTPRTKEKQEKPDRLSPGNLVDQAVPEEHPYATVPWHRSVGCQTLSISSKKYEFHLGQQYDDALFEDELENLSKSIKLKRMPNNWLLAVIIWINFAKPPLGKQLVSLYKQG